MARSAGFILGGPNQSNHQQQQQHAATVSSSGVTFSTGSNQDCFQLHGSNLFPSSYGTYHSLVIYSSNGYFLQRAKCLCDLASGIVSLRQKAKKVSRNPNDIVWNFSFCGKLNVLLGPRAKTPFEASASASACAAYCLMRRF